MEQYEEFLNKIKKYFEYDEVITQGTIISAYDLIQIIKKTMGDLRSVIRNEENEFIKDVNEYYISQEKVGRFIKKLIKVNLAEVEYFFLRFKENHAELTMGVWLNHNRNTPEHSRLKICKDHGSDELYFENSHNVDKDFVEYFKETIIGNLQKIEYFYNLFKLSLPDIEEIPSYFNGYKIQEEISDNFLRIVISYDVNGKVDYKISIDPSIDLNNIYNREWLNHESIREYIEKNEEELLKKIPINILDLKATTKQVITDYYAKENTQGQKLVLK